MAASNKSRQPAFRHPAQRSPKSCLEGLAWQLRSRTGLRPVSCRASTQCAPTLATISSWASDLASIRFLCTRLAHWVCPNGEGYYRSPEKVPKTQIVESDLNRLRPSGPSPGDPGAPFCDCVLQTLIFSRENLSRAPRGSDFHGRKSELAKRIRKMEPRVGTGEGTRGPQFFKSGSKICVFGPF